ncbi:polysaccharide biosynthesis/export family protein [Caulobacter soli]|uniref:polysaccharide biosynthesis/export family protein n=1 Tax=Caulobacter soli TaxID=2708539 RepID=UPI0013EB149F|nr:polysaccharide biosynthesis/export family protein [Caulobacter soli]
MYVVRRIFRSTLAVLAAVFVVSTLPLSAAQAQTPPAAVAGEAPPASASDYLLGSGDKVRVTVYGEPELSGEFFVTGSGLVSLPLIGEVRAAGLNVRQFQDTVQNALSNGYLKEPRVSAEVLSFRPFYILGEVDKPGTYPYTSGLTVFNAVATAGGFTYRADKGKVFIKRLGEAVEHKYTLDPTVTVAPGDTIRIGERFF